MTLIFAIVAVLLPLSTNVLGHVLGQLSIVPVYLSLANIKDT